MKKSVAVAMSGGVDSSYALIKLKEEGYDVFGITLKLFCYGETPMSEKSCCSLEAIKDAKGICSSLEVPHMVINAEEAFKKEIIDYFIKEYEKGYTPNPCVKCNSIIKWDYLFKKALSSGADFLATGHYSRIGYNNERERYILKTGLDKSKDQSYYLWSLNQEQLKRTIFPLGEMTKEEVKYNMGKYDLKMSEKQESQEICFIPDNDYRKFLKEEGNIDIKKGNIINKSGEFIGRHEGYPFYTIGQRRGLGVPSKERLYVSTIDTLKNEITLAHHDDLFRKDLVFSSSNFISYEFPPENTALKARIRYRGKLHRCKLKKLEEEKFLITFNDPVWGVCPGQSVVIYEDDTVVAGGVIEK